MFLQALVNGLISGSTLALLALAFSLVYQSCRVFHISLGAVVTLTPYAAMITLQMGAAWWAAAVAALASAVGLSLACEVVNHQPLDRKQASHGAHLIGSLGIYIVVTQIVAIAWGDDVQVLRNGMDSTSNIGDLTISGAQWLSAGVSSLLFVGLIGWLRFSRLGLRLRALADNPIQFCLSGHNAQRYRLVAFAVSGLLGGVAALLTAYDVGFDPHSGLHALLLAVVAMIVGGRSSFYGPIVGGLLLGVVRDLVSWQFSAQWQDVFTFLLLGIVLYIQPNGLIGRRSRLEVQQ